MSGVGPHLSDYVLGDLALNRSDQKLSGYPKPKKKFPMPPNCRTITRLTGNDSPDWRLFTDGGFERQVDGSDLAGWGIAAVSPDNFVRILCGPVTCDPRHQAFLGATSCSNNTAELTGFAEVPRWTNFSALVGNGCISSMIPSTLRVLFLVSLMVKRTSPWPTNVMTLFCAARADAACLFIMFFAMLATRRINVLTQRLVQHFFMSLTFSSKLLRYCTISWADCSRNSP